MRRAFADTKMTGCALLLEVFPTDRPRRSDRIFLFVCLLTFQACYRFLGLAGMMQPTVSFEKGFCNFD